MHFCTLSGHFDTTSMQQYQNTTTLGPENPLFHPQNGPKWNISSITTQTLPQGDVNHILMHSYALLGHFDTKYMQQYQNTMTLGPENPGFLPAKWTKMEYFVNNDTQTPPR